MREIRVYTKIPFRNLRVKQIWILVEHVTLRSTSRQMIESDAVDITRRTPFKHFNIF